MRKTVIYCEYCDGLVKAIDYIKRAYKVYIEVELCEMNFVELDIIANAQDIIFIEKILAPYV